MAIREKFGKLILLEHGEPGPLGQECRAARLGPAGLDRVVTVVRFAAAVSSSAEATKRLVEEARLAARIQSPGLARVLGIGRVEQSFYIWTELVEGKSVAAILERCRAEGFPFAPDQALMIASRAAAALEPLHAKRDDAGEPLAHGLLAPSRLVVTYDGEVKIRGLGLWPGLRGTGLLPPEECLYLAPEQAAGEAGGPRSDVYALGQILLVTLAGLAPGGADPASRLAGAQLTSTTGERAPLPPPLVELLRRALDPDPAGRFAGAAALRKAIDALVFSGDLAPTTFDLAFFMNTLFREEMEREAQALEEARSASYAEFLVEERPAPAPPATEPDSAPPATEPDSAPEPPLPVPPPAAPIPTDVPLPAVAEAPRRTVPERTPAAREAAAREAAAREAAARMTLGATAPADRRGLWLLLGLLGVVIVGGGAGFSYFVKLRGPALATPTTLGASAAAAQERVRELEARIAQLEREKGEAVARAAQEARQAVEAGAAAGGGTADPSTIAQAQEEARRRARAELEAQQQEELRRLADEKRAEERRLAEATPTPVLADPPTAAPVPEAVATPTPTPTPEPPPPPAPSTRPGSLVEYADPDLTRPVVVVEPKTRYPPLAEQRKLGGTVELLALVDETGAVAEVTVVTASPRGLGFEAEATRSVKGRRYRPGTKDGVAVRVWVPIIVKFGTP